MSRAPAPLRVLRGCVVAVAALLIAGVAHVLGGGAVELGAWSVVVAGLVLTACVLASASVWSPARSIAVLVGTQLLVHTTLWMSSSGHDVDPRLRGLAGAGHVHAETLGMQPAMLAGHVIAVALTAALLSSADRVAVQLWTLARAVLGSGRRLGGRVAPRVARVLVPGALPVPHSPHLARTPRRRGPPVGLAPC